MALFELSAVNVLDLFFKLFPDKSDQQQKVSVLFRTLYGECVSNMQILDSFKREHFNKENTHRAVKTIAPLLKNEAGQLILLGTDGSLKQLKILEEQIDFEAEAEDAEEEADLTKVKTTRQAISFCVNKIQFLKNYAAVDEENTDLFRELNLKTRLNNIYNYSKQIKTQLNLHMPTMFE